MFGIKRREFITLLGGAVASWPLAAQAQERATPVIGYLNTSAFELNAQYVVAFRKGLGEAGFVEGRNVTIEFRSAQNEIARLPELAADLVQRKVSVIAAFPGTAAVAAKAATKTIPIVFLTGSDPVAQGLVASFNRPGGNVTGVANMSVELVVKRLDLLRKIVPNADLFSLLINPATLNAKNRYYGDADGGAHHWEEAPRRGGQH
jgi:putative ABC transport system substrate-binding protein